jgi:hypothetical protein
VSAAKRTLYGEDRCAIVVGRERGPTPYRAVFSAVIKGEAVNVPGAVALPLSIS